MENLIDKTYDPKAAEDKWYARWEKDGCFKPKKGKAGKTFSLIMPPPNVTGKLHMGHALDATTQDALIRFKRMKGFETLWIPGTDHAGIATQSVVEKLIQKEEKKNRHEIGRDEFLKRIWQWKEQYGTEIVNQQKKMGVSCDWDYSTFTMDEIPNKAVRKFFVHMYNEGLIYQSDYIVNWDPKLQSAISDAEVEHKEVKGFFYHLLYKVKGSEDILEVATTRPETIFADTAVAVHPEDERFKHLIGLTAIIPICNREVPIIGDEHVDMEKGTGCLKVTPGHDFNDFEIGKRHGLPIINILNPNGTFNSSAPEIEGLKVKDAREKVEAILNELSLLKEKKPHTHQVGHGERSDAVIEPLVSKQWFLNVRKMAEDAVAAVESGAMTFYPKGWENTYFSWLREPKDWCISRQLWWGHQIPVFYCLGCGHQWASESDPKQCPQCKHTELKQDPDVLDTWFSSGLWPLSTLGWPDEKAMAQKRFNDFYPTATLVTGFDIIFFWVARMMMMCQEMTGKAPFAHVYVHAIVRDKHGKKMSKSLGNGIDPLDMIAQYGADAMRFTLAAGSGYNRNLNLDPERIEGYRNFMNKLWNAFRFIQPHLELASDELPPKDQWHLHDRWILAELNTVAGRMNDAIDEYRFDDASSAIYQFVYEKFCSWYIELSKNILNGNNEAAKRQRASVLKYGFRQIMKLLHPITPYITEELWSHLGGKTLLATESYAEFDPHLSDDRVADLMNRFIEVVTGIRNIRQSMNIKPKDQIDVRLFTDDKKFAKFLYDSRHFLGDLAAVKSGTIREKSAERPKRSASMATTHTEIWLPLEGLVDIEEQIKRVQKDIEKTQGDYQRVEAKLSNRTFVDNAPEDVVADVKEKARQFQEKLQSLQTMLGQFQ
ncbi:MAG: valine--tRNA ligase [Bacteriovoracia bacterium]